ncbi:MAG TPA: DUF4292 domain-containing protein [Bacteroidales bacterium]|nr:DUF4292 domain-containing protein [Bacteroidales bacterium]
MFRKKKIIVIILTFVVSSCATSLKSLNNNEIYSNPEVIIDETLRNNVSNYGFFIQKGKLDIKNENERTRLIFTVKHLPPDNYLISLRSVTGIEAMRVKLSKDTIIVNDRINREILYGKGEAFERIAGVPIDLLVLAFGDLSGVNIKFKVNNEIKNNTIDVYSNIKDINIISTINCNLKKVKKATVFTNQQGNMLVVSYSDFKRGNTMVPGTIDIKNEKGNIRILIKIKKIIIPWHGEIEFIPGNGYMMRSL